MSRLKFRNILGLEKKSEEKFKKKKNWDYFWNIYKKANISVKTYLYTSFSGEMFKLGIILDQISFCL